MKETENAPTLSQRAELFWEKHKKTIIIGTSIVVGGALIVLGIYSYKNAKIDLRSLNPCVKKLPIRTEKIVAAPISTTSTDTVIDVIGQIIDPDSGKIIQVPLQIRRLPLGQKPSPAKIQLAEEMGIDLLNNTYTIVNPYSYLYYPQCA